MARKTKIANRQWDVEFTITAYACITVEAPDEAAAREVARREINLRDVTEWTCEIDGVGDAA